jgi:hypothetical protein
MVTSLRHWTIRAAEKRVVSTGTGTGQMSALRFFYEDVIERLGVC